MDPGDEILVIGDKSTPRKRDCIDCLANLDLRLKTDLKIADFFLCHLYNRKKEPGSALCGQGIQTSNPKEIQHRLSTNVSNKDIFEWWKKEYEKALKNGRYGVKLEYKDRERNNTQKRRNRPRKILSFTHSRIT